MMKSNQISKTETAQAMAAASSEWGIELPKVRNLTAHEVAEGRTLLVGEGVSMVRIDGRYLPFLGDEATLLRFQSATVDMGAVKFVCKGADIMRPGITGFGQFGAGEIITVREESRGKFIAVGRALVPSSEMENMERGRAVANAHYISDIFWEAQKSL